MADIQEKTKVIHSKIFMIPQNFQGLKTVNNPNKINNIANHSITQRGHHFFIYSLLNNINQNLYNNFMSKIKFNKKVALRATHY